MFTVALIGGIASGKSTASKIFSELGIETIDADVISREIIDIPEIKTKVIGYFGEQVVSNKQLQRNKIREIVFKYPEKRKWLEQLLHPLIIQSIKAKIAAAKSPYVIVVIPLNISQELLAVIDRILLIDIIPELQLKRAISRDGEILEDIKNIIAAQPLREDRLKIADDVIDNNGNILDLSKKVKIMHDKYLKIIN